MEAKSNEIPALPEVLALLDLTGITVTVDAMGCQKDLARHIRSQQTGYVLTVKDNQRTLRTALEETFAEERRVRTGHAPRNLGLLRRLVLNLLAGHNRQGRGSHPASQGRLQLRLHGAGPGPGLILRLPCVQGGSSLRMVVTSPPSWVCSVGADECGKYGWPVSFLTP